MINRRGIAVSPGVVSGPALILGAEDFRVPKLVVTVDAVETETERFHVALESTYKEISENEKLATERLGKQYGAIFAAHLQLAQDPKLIGEIEELIRTRNYSSEFAASRVLRKFAKIFQNLGNSYLAERAADLFDLEKRILRHLSGKTRTGLSNLQEPVVILAHDLTPSETANLNREFVLGFATEVGGHTSHTAILAGALEIPAIVGVGNFLTDVSSGENIILDGTQGDVIIDPDEETITQYRDSMIRQKSVTERLQSLRPLRAETTDGTRIQVMGNIEFPEEVGHCTERGADGVGLYRTEFLYLERDKEPTEENHYDAYKKVISTIQDRPVIIRTLDLGADKIPSDFKDLIGKQANPVLGLRSIRLCLRNLPLFKTQLRAILRAAVEGDVRIMFPLITSLMELRQAKMILSDVMEDLEEEGIPFKRDISVGMMVEVPAAALLAKEFAREVDFLSIGTNDLIQYTLAVDRSDPNVASLYRPGDPSILRMIQTVIAAADNQGIPVTVCGQMSSDPKFVPLLIGLGLRQISVTPLVIPELKEVIRSLSLDQAKEIAEHALSLEIARDVENYLRGELHKFCPDLVV